LSPAAAARYPPSLHDALPILTGAYLGAAVATAGDINGDGISDLLIGAPGQGGVGAASLFHGKPDPPAAAAQWSYSGSQNLGYLRSEEHTSELQSRENLVCRLL